MSYAQNTPYKEGGAGFNDSSTGFIHPTVAATRAPKKGLSPWIKFGVPIFILVAVGAVVGGVLGTRKSSSSGDNKDGSGGSNGGGSGGGSGGGNSKGPSASGAIATATDKLAAGRFAVATNSKYMIPIYPSATNTALFGPPTIAPAAAGWPADDFKPAGAPSPLTVRQDRPRLIAPKYKWDALPALIRADPYLAAWNETIFKNATDYWAAAPITYALDGPSGILDNAREFKMRIKAFGYAWRMSQNTRWPDRAYREILHVSSAGFGDDGATKWNPGHFLDTAEFSAAFGIAYDWFYDTWTQDQKDYIRNALITYGLNHGVNVFKGTTTFGWWAGDITGNWNCVCNGGLTLGALAILGDDTTGVATEILGETIDNAKAHFANAVTSDGSCAESPTYWYFGTTGHAEMTSALLTATGSHYGLMDINPNFYKTGTYHMYVFGTTSLFDYADHGPNKFSTTANSMLLYGDLSNHPEFILHQREQWDAADPWSMFWYNPAVSGAFWNGLDLDHFFDDPLVQWASMRSTWTDYKGLFVAVKAGHNAGHQTHNDLDVGDFVVDALGTRWAGDLGSGDYLSTGYFDSGAQDAERWKYYRKHTMGQNTIVVNNENQLITSAPTIIAHGSTGEKQSSTTAYTPPDSSTAFWVADLTSAYGGGTDFKRGVRLINGRRQVLLQDEITATGDIQWRMHTNATVTIDSAGTSAELSLDNEKLTVLLVDPPAGAKFTTVAADRQGVTPIPAFGDQENKDTRVLVVRLAAGTYTLRVLFNPHWPGVELGALKTPPSVALDAWKLDSHN